MAHLFISGCAFPGGPAFQELTRTGDAATLIQRLADHGGIRTRATEPEPDTRLTQHLRALIAYRFDHTTLACPLTCLAGQDDAIAARESMLPWSNVTSRSFEIIDLPGDHFFFSGRNRRIGAIIRQSLAGH